MMMCPCPIGFDAIGEFREPRLGGTSARRSQDTEYQKGRSQKHLEYRTGEPRSQGNSFSTISC
jgi:hypothetical protein